MLNTQSLRTKILDLAMRGQLTEQLPTDGTAEDLYQRIQAEKQDMIKAGKIKKEKPLPPIGEDEIPFEVPKGWRWSRLGEIAAKITSGNTPKGGKKSDVYVETGYPFFREQNIYNDGIRDEGMVYITEDLLNTRQNSTVLAKDILLNITGGSIGRCALIPDNFDKGSINQHILIIRMIFDALRFYIHLLICSPYIQSYIKDKSVGDKDGFSGSRCKMMLIPLPPLAEQQRIVSRIDAAFAELDVIDKLQAAYHKNREVLRKKLIDAAIRGELTQRLPGDGTAEDLYQKIQAEKQDMIKAGKIKKEKPLPPIGEDEIPFEVPKGWRWCRLGEISQLITKGSSPKWQGIEYSNDNTGILFITSENVGNEALLLHKKKYIEKKFNDMHPTSILRKGDVLTNIVGASIGRTAIYNLDDIDANINQAVCVIRLVNPIMANYLVKYLNASNTICIMLNNTVDTARAI